MQHPNDLKKLTLIVNELSKVDEKEHGEIDPVEEDDQAHVGLVSLEFEIVQLFHEVVHIHREHDVENEKADAQDTVSNHCNFVQYLKQIDVSFDDPIVKRIIEFMNCVNYQEDKANR